MHQEKSLPRRAAESTLCLPTATGVSRLMSFVAVACFGLATQGTALSQAPSYPPQFEQAEEHTYKSIDDVQLKLWAFYPKDHQPTDQRAAVVFFFGGGWKGGNPAQFHQHCLYLASRGMVAITADYRVRSRHQTLADRCVADAKSAIRWVRVHAKELGVDPNRIVAGGGSAGGHLAACTTVVTELDEPGEDHSVSSVPNACVLFNPALLIAPYEDVTLDEEKILDIASRTGVTPQRISPIHNIRSELPPMIVFHGKDDPTVPYRTIEKFRDATQASGNPFVLCGYDGQAHGFFNYGRGGTPGEYFLRTVVAMDDFLTERGFLDGESTLSVPQSTHVHLRNALPNVSNAIRQKQHATVAFIGGSITEMNGYRPMIMQHLSETHPETKFDFVNAGISSTCSTTGSFRISRDVLSHKPDLLFVEFAVNDDQDAAHANRECVRGMEGIVRSIASESPNTDVVITYFVNPGMLKLIQADNVPISIAAHERVANHYGICSVHLAAEVADRIDNGSLTWETYGGTHPKKPGNRLAADLNIQALDAAWQNAERLPAPEASKRLPKMIDRNSYTDGELVDVSRAEFDKGWRIETPNWTELKGKSRDRYIEEQLLCGDFSGDPLSLSFEGRAVGAFLLAGPDAGTVEVSIDGGPVKSIDLYHRFSKGLHYPRTVMFATDLKPGSHRLELRVSNKSNPASSGHAVRIMNFTVNGMP